MALVLTTPALVQPVARVRSSFSGLFGDSLVVLAGLLEEGVALTGLGHGNAVAIAEGLELALGPGVEDPVLDVAPALLRLVIRLVPGALDPGDERVATLFGRLLGLKALLLQIVGELFCVPRLVGLDDVGIPFALDELLEIFPVGGGRDGDAVVRQPPLKLRLVPLVVGCDVTSANSFHEQRVVRTYQHSRTRSWQQQRWPKGPVGGLFC
jgi:hypothetical protein